VNCNCCLKVEIDSSSVVDPDPVWMDPGKIIPDPGSSGSEMIWK
jgi:hypothetical protein